jgi:hypothetical protein
MATITFDTLKYVERLKAAGVAEDHAKAEAEALRDVLSESIDTRIATKVDIAVLEGKNNLLQWMIALNLAFTMAILWKVFSV